MAVPSSEMPGEIPGEIPQQRSTGFWPWLFQRTSGLLLIFLLAIHMRMGHFSGLADVLAGNREAVVLYEVVKQRLAQSFFVLVDFSLPGLVLFHGLNGIRNILLEWEPLNRRRQALTIGLLALGGITFVYGARALLLFIFAR